MIFRKRFRIRIEIREWRIVIVFLITGLNFFFTSAQITPVLFREYLLKKTAGPEVKYLQGVKEFYSINGYQTAWMQQKDNLSCLLNDLSMAGTFGLSEKDYQYSFISKLKNGTSLLQNMADSLNAEILLCDAAIHFYSDIAYGNSPPSLRYTGINYNPDCSEIPAVLAESALKNKIEFLSASLSPALKEVSLIKDKINWIYQIMQEKDFKEISITSTKINTDDRRLIQKLYQLGIIRSQNESVSENILRQEIREAQLMFSLPVTGELKKETISQLNVPLKVRLDQLRLSINYYRWLSCLSQNQSVIVVNIPAAYLKVYKSNKVILEMRMIVGKFSTQTSTLASIVDQVILYPFWHVPLSIATKELLPAIKRNPSFLDNNNYQVINKAGKIVNPYSVNWKALSRSYFPYTLRQGTGCDNSLGLLKLNFYNPFGAYLHDTPNKDLFKQYRRFYSHGCMRMEKPIELGHLILKNNQVAIDTLTEKGCLKNQAPIIVPADVKMPVIVWYNPAGVDSTGRVLFFEDVYRKFNWKK